MLCPALWVVWKGNCHAHLIGLGAGSKRIGWAADIGPTWRTLCS